MLIVKLGAAFSLCAALAPAAAQNLLVNGGFETGDFSGWSLEDDIDDSAVRLGAFGGVAPAEGAYQASFGSDDPDFGLLIQRFAATPGAFYNVAFSLANLGDAPNAFLFTFGGDPLRLEVDAAPFGYRRFSGVVQAIAPSTRVQFQFFHPESFWLLDDVSVTLATGAVVPEPVTWALMISGFGLVGGAMRRRRTDVTA